MRVVFLDIDGVALPLLRRDFEKQRDVDLRTECCARINRLCQETDAKVVISSSWRYEVLDEIGKDNFRTGHLHSKWLGIAAYLKQQFGLDVPVIGFTPDISGGPTDFDMADGNRGREIHLWLAEHPEVTTFVILDDMPGWIGPRFPDNFVRAVPIEGFTEDDFQKAVAILTAPDPVL